MSNYIIYNGELYHHGVKGMKWGVRKAMRKDVKRYEKEEYDRLYKKYNIEGKHQEAFRYGEKHKLDLDDGGGGSARAGRKYMKMWEEIESLDTKAYDDAKKYANNRLIKKYGEESVSKFIKSEPRIRTAKVAATLFAFGVLLGLPSAIIAAKNR